MSPRSSPEAMSRVPASLEEALVKLRLDDHQLQHLGDDGNPCCWDLGQGLGITLLRTATRDAPARCARVSSVGIDRALNG